MGLKRFEELKLHLRCIVRKKGKKCKSHWFGIIRALTFKRRDLK